MIPIRNKLTCNLAAFALILAFNVGASASTLCDAEMRKQPLWAEECAKLDEARDMADAMNRAVAALAPLTEAMKDYNAEMRRRNEEMLKQERQK